MMHTQTGAGAAAPAAHHFMSPFIWDVHGYIAAPSGACDLMPVVTVWPQALLLLGPACAAYTAEPVSGDAPSFALSKSSTGCA